MKIFFKLLIIIIFSTSIFTNYSCVSRKDTILLQNLADTSSIINNSFDADYTDYKVQNGDFLMIRIFSQDEKSNELFNSFNSATNMTNMNEASMYINSYNVSQEGKIALPLLGDIDVKGKTTSQIQDILFEKYSNYIIEPTISVKLVAFHISILGEVNNPGRFLINKNKVNIFEAIALAGDLKTYANRKQVKIVRNINNESNIINLDIRKADLLASENYYLQPNDIIYIEPMSSKRFTFESFPYSLVLTTVTSTITTFLLILNYMKK